MAVYDIEVHHAELVTHGGSPELWWAISYRKVFRDGAPPQWCVFHMPEDGFENFCAEYDWPADQVAELLAHLLYDADEATVVTADHPDHLLNAKSRAAAREAWIARVAVVRGNGEARGITGDSEVKPTPDHTPRHVAVVREHSGAGCPVEFIGRRCHRDPEWIRLKAAHVEQRRAAARRQQRPSPPRGERVLPEHLQDITDSEAHRQARTSTEEPGP